MSVKVTDNRVRFDALVGELYSREGRTLSVGIPEDRAQLTDAHGITAIRKAVWAEFGTPNAPARSWLLGWCNENEDLIRFWMRGELRLVIEGKQTKVQALRRVGEKAVASIKERIVNRIPPPNAPSTIKKKGSDVPLIETGHFLGAIGAKVE